jgi:hypothetical protein
VSRLAQRAGYSLLLPSFNLPTSQNFNLKDLSLCSVSIVEFKPENMPTWQRRKMSKNAKESEEKSKGSV